MKSPTFCAVLIYVCSIGIGTTNAFAQAQGARPIRMIVTFPPGSGIDIVARLVAQKMAETLDRPIVIDNRAGAGGVIGSSLAAQSAPDGNTIVMVSAGHTINPSVYTKLPYDSMRDFSPVTMLVFGPYLLVSNPSVPVRDVAGLIALAKSKPGQLNYAAGGVAVGSHLAGELFKMTAGVDIVTIAYKGTPQAVADVIGGQVQLAFTTLPPALLLVRSGKLRALGVTSLQRTKVSPEVPTIAETLPGFEVGTWQGLLAPAGTAATIVDTLRDHAVRALKLGEVTERLVSLGYDVVGSTSAEFRQTISAETARWNAVVKKAGIQPM